MLSQRENELVVRTGPSTPSGELMRRYWIPALLSRELSAADCPPVRVKLLGERLVGFRDTQGRVGILDEFCAHRRASLFLGRNEECGLRCVYHGWKFDIEGNCLDTPNEPPELDFKHKIHLKAYPTVETGGVIWAYMGPRDKMPAAPKFEWTQVPETHRHVSKVWEECNWLQAMEGGLDSAHTAFLHRKLTADSSKQGISPKSYKVRAMAPKLEIDLTDYGYMYASVRSLAEGDYVRIYHYVMPFHQLRSFQLGGGGVGEKRPIIKGHMWVPMDDENCMVYNWTYSFGDDSLREEDRIEKGIGNGPDDVDFANNFRKKRHKDNNWLIDRDAQKVASYTGIFGTNTQDHAIQESMGSIVDRTQEHLGSTDRAIIMARRLILKAANTVKEGGSPPGLDPDYYSIRAIEKVLPTGTNWREALKKEINGPENVQMVNDRVDWASP